jgi:tetratricopeptide (TPR) repeat protein
VLSELPYPEEAIPLYPRAHRVAPALNDVVNNLGIGLLACERAEDAFDSYRRAVALEPDFADAWLQLANALERQDRYQEAAGCLMEEDRLRPGDPLFALRRAASCPAVFPNAEAIARYRAALESTLDAFRGAGLTCSPVVIRRPDVVPEATENSPCGSSSHAGRIRDGPRTGDSILDAAQVSSPNRLGSPKFP